MVIVTEWCAGGSLAKSLAAEDATGTRRMAWRSRGRLVALGIARGLAYLHSMQVMTNPDVPLALLCSPNKPFISSKPYISSSSKPPLLSLCSMLRA